MSCDLQGAEFLYEADWGEQLSSVVRPVPVVMDVGRGECEVVRVWEVADISGEV